ncbi:MAG: hypothetical protein ACW98X_27500 [Promethearchaeota archaeon]
MAENRAINFVINNTCGLGANFPIFSKIQVSTRSYIFVDPR